MAEFVIDIHPLRWADDSTFRNHHLAQFAAAGALLAGDGLLQTFTTSCTVASPRGFAMAMLITQMDDKHADAT